eukprot:gene15427-645_t
MATEGGGEKVVSSGPKLDDALIQLEWNSNSSNPEEAPDYPSLWSITESDSRTSIALWSFLAVSKWAGIMMVTQLALLDERNYYNFPLAMCWSAIFVGGCGVTVLCLTMRMITTDETKHYATGLNLKFLLFVIGGYFSVILVYYIATSLALGGEKFYYYQIQVGGAVLSLLVAWITMVYLMQRHGFNSLWLLFMSYVALMIIFTVLGTIILPLYFKMGSFGRIIIRLVVFPFVVMSTAFLMWAAVRRVRPALALPSICCYSFLWLSISSFMGRFMISVEGINYSAIISVI